MQNIKVDFSKKLGKMKPMHAVNNGPVHKFNTDMAVSNFEAYKAASLPFARIHDANHCSSYGGPHIVDTYAIFPDFDADPYDEASYDFACTDEYLRVIDASGTKIFYRLGVSIEHYIKKYFAKPPKDFKKWAIICEHIIKHYVYGWADGFRYDIKYWEIWNEPDNNNPSLTWGGTPEQFYELFNVAYTHLKASFPELKFGGPSAAMGIWNKQWLEGLFESLQMKPDFFSWHIYAQDIEAVIDHIRKYRNWLDEHGCAKTESILNEWNYVRGWEKEDWLYSKRVMKSMKGAAFIASVISASQYEDIDMLMYYDARPCGMCGMFDTDFVCDLLKGYYPFKMFSELYKLGECVAVESVDNIYAVAATNGDSSAIMLTYFDDALSEGSKDISVALDGICNEKTAEIYLLDDEHDMELVDTVKITNELKLNMKLYSSVLIKIS